MCTDVVKYVQTAITSHRDNVKLLVESENVAKVIPALQQGCDNATMQSLLPTAASEASKGIHTHVKQLEVFRDVMLLMKPMESFIEGVLQMDEEVYTNARSMNCILAVIQALTRPLITSKHETRAALARRARLMVVSKGKEGTINMPSNLELMMNKIAGATEHEAAAGKTASSASSLNGQ